MRKMLTIGLLTVVIISTLVLASGLFNTAGVTAAPILVHVLYAEDVPSLVLILAHEIFHQTQPFGAVKDTRFEEYWAFRLEAQITPAGAMSFSGFDPLVPAELDCWLHANQLDG